MVNIAKRMAKLRTLLGIRLGPGAAVLPREVVRIHLDFAAKFNDGHLGPRKFWRDMLPRLKYHNPGVPMTVARSTDQAGPATLTVTFSAPSTSTTSTSTTTSTTAPPAPSAEARTETIAMKHLHERDILAALLALTRGAPVAATAAEEAQLAELRAREEAARRDRADAGVRNERTRRREAVLEMARGDVAAGETQAA
ncbi:MAG: hypothetical protein M1832_006344 [Thelocarpon impressellum]|nr:MAG: hypothetical protein M1832_006344 [Thelocarpon impressellum]